MCKTASRYWNMRSLEADMAMDLTPLTQQTGACPTCDISTHVWPTKTATNQAAGSTDTRVTDVVEVEKHQLPEGGRHQRAENTGGNVSKDFYTFNQLGYNIETGQQFHGGDLWAKLLCCSNERKIDRLRSGGGGP
jgi:hypothetical protein